MNKHVLLLDHAHRFCLNIAAGFQCARSIFYRRPLAAAMFLIFTGFVPSILPAGAASFLCGNYKNTLVEKYICANHEISQLDFQLGIINQQSLDVSEDKVAIQRQQHEWLTRKRDICRDEQCVKTAYTARIKELKIALYGRRPDILRWADPVNPVPIDPSDRPTLDLSGISIGATTLSQPRGTQALLLDFGGGNSITYNGGFRDGGQIYQFAGDELNQQQIMQYLTTPVFLIGTGIADTIYGSNHNDNLYGHTGNETHPDNADHLYGQGGDDILEGGLGDDTLDGGEGNDRLLGQPGNDTLLGGLGDDRLFGNEGNDILDGGANNDYLEGGAGSDTYIFGRASGYDTLTEEESANMGSIDTIELDAGILPADVTISRDGWDLVLALDQGPVQLRMRSFFETSTTHNKRIERVVFHDGPAGTVGTVWDAATIKAKTLSGTPNEQLSSLRRGGWALPMRSDTTVNSYFRGGC